MLERIEDRSVERPPSTTILVDGAPIAAYPGESVAAAMLAAGIRVFRRSPRDVTPRAPFCFMGVCQECAIVIDGRLAVACQEPVRGGMTVELAPAR